MDIHNWKIFDKKGSYINWFRDSYIDISFVTDSQNSIGADAYAITDPSGYINDVVIANSGWNYDPNNTMGVISYAFDENYANYP
ncbi:MAG: hypothetical protein HC831_02145 [Chloroflexia bacterium]|nr:hypothetical protein [Chloroflexia bacterium]